MASPTRTHGRITSPSPRSSSEVLAALLDLSRLSLNNALEDVTACWSDETFWLELSSSSPSEKVLSLPVSSGSRAALKSTGDLSLAGDSEDDDVLNSDLERMALLGESSKSWYLLVGDRELLTSLSLVSGEGERDGDLLTPVEEKKSLLARL